ncbi:hypothetical protein ACFFWC_12825 [Plantactinospora siamensis]|uniref:Uncharacterized protein n=1 Tax=Plantactinospora siamensis TaxID=555372 RepID=A0ABV6P1Y2_9ACTN
MTEPEEDREKTPKTDAILFSPTANPRRVRCPGDHEGPCRHEEDAGSEGAGDDERPTKEAS